MFLAHLLIGMMICLPFDTEQVVTLYLWGTVLVTRYNLKGSVYREGFTFVNDPVSWLALKFVMVFNCIFQ
jgi:hypothetical protein